MKNIWIQTNAKRIEKVKRQLIEYNYAGSYGGAINLMEVNNIIDGLLVELTKLQKQVEELKHEVKKLTKENIETNDES